MPILEPAADLGVIAGGLAAAFGHKGSAYVDVAEVTGSNPQTQQGPSNNAATVNFIVSPDNQKSPLTEGGIVGQRFAANSLTMDQQAQKLHFGGPNSPENLDLTMDQKTQALHLDGKIGTVDTHLTFTAPNLGQSKDTISVHAEGTLGGEAYVADTIIKGVASANNTQVSGGMSLRGKLGSADVSKDYTISGDSSNGNVNLAIHGQGNVAGIPEQVDAKVRLGS